MMDGDLAVSDESDEFESPELEGSDGEQFGQSLAGLGRLFVFTVLGMCGACVEPIPIAEVRRLLVPYRLVYVLPASVVCVLAVERTAFATVQGTTARRALRRA